MKNIIKRISLLLAVPFAVLAIAQPVLAQTPAPAPSPKDSVCEGVGLAGGGTGCADPAGSPTVNSIVKTIISFLSFIVGIVAVIMIIIGGLQYITSGGDSGKISTAKNTILYAIIGLVVVVLAQVIVRFVLNNIN